MSKEDIIRKLTSRKLWMAIALFVSGLLVAFGKDAEQAEVISGLIMQGAAVIAYIVGEGLVDMGRVDDNADHDIYFVDEDDYIEQDPED